jgi:hypothetical protein
VDMLVINAIQHASSISMKPHILTEADFISVYPACLSQTTNNPIIMTTLELSGHVTKLEGLCCEGSVGGYTVPKIS